MDERTFLAAGASVLALSLLSTGCTTLFMTPEALKRFEQSSGWTAGVDASVTMVSVGANARVNTQDIRQEVVGFALSNAGLMADLSVNGTRINRLDL